MAVVLLSGGLDSATVLAIARHEGFRPHTLSVDYGQRHRAELHCAQRVAEALGSERHTVVRVDLRAIGGSALTSAEIDVPKDRVPDPDRPDIPPTYVPARNTILLSLALGLAECVGAFDIFLGANVYDYSGYPDCRPEFLDAFGRLAQLATKAGVEHRGRFQIHAPLIRMTKAQIIRTGVDLGVDYALTLSCYDPDEEGRACGRCDSCYFRRKGFVEAGVPDPTVYQTEPARGDDAPRAGPAT
jgi:7-cyano-7-deazaguanine synthase